jgi:hypothetical protein
VFGIHPLQLSRWLGEVWGRGGLVNWPNWPGTGTPSTPLGAPDVDARLQLPGGLLSDGLRSGIGPGPAAIPPVFALGPSLGTGIPLPWDHLIYAYLIESTRVIEILGEVVRRYVTGETLDPPSVETLVWARNTEELFFRDPPLFHIGGITSSLRPDANVNRRNAYWRLFGCDLPHPLPGQPDPQAWKRHVGAGAKYPLPRALARAAPAGLARHRERPQRGWREPDRPRLRRLPLSNPRRDAPATPTRRDVGPRRVRLCLAGQLVPPHGGVRHLRRCRPEGHRGCRRQRGGPVAIGARVGITPPRGARELFELADLLSPLLWFIELDQFSEAANASLLFKSFGAPNPPIPSLMTRIIDLWQSATGVRVKDLAVTTRQAAVTAAPAMPQPTRLPAGPALGAVPAQTPASRNSGAPARR